MTTICLSTKVWRSGTAWVAQMLAQALASEGSRVIFVAPLAEPEEREPSHRNVQRIILSRELVSGQPKLRRIFASLRRINGNVLSVLRARAYTRNFIFTIPEPLIFTLPLFVLLRISRAHIIFLVHDAQPHAWSLPLPFRVLERQAHAMSYRIATKIVVLTPTVKIALEQTFNVEPTKINVIPHGPFSVGNVGPVPGSGKFLLFGSFRKNKSVLQVIDGVIIARRSDPDIRLVLAGEPLKQEADYWDLCLATIAKDPDGFLLREGFLPDEDLPNLISDVDCFVLAYDNFDSQSGVGVLAAISGRPVIGTYAGGLRELFERGMSGQIIEGSVTGQTVADAILAFRDQGKEIWDEKARDGALRVAKTLSWDIIAQDYIRLCSSPMDRQSK